MIWYQIKLCRSSIASIYTTMVSRTILQIQKGLTVIILANVRTTCFGCCSLWWWCWRSCWWRRWWRWWRYSIVAIITIICFLRCFSFFAIAIISIPYQCMKGAFVAFVVWFAWARITHCIKIVCIGFPLCAIFSIINKFFVASTLQCSNGSFKPKATINTKYKIQKLHFFYKKIFNHTTNFHSITPP